MNIKLHKEGTPVIVLVLFLLLAIVLLINILFPVQTLVMGAHGPKDLYVLLMDVNS